MRSMKFFLVLLSVLYAAADDMFNENDPFIRHIRKYKNDAIHPCDDFFRHICPEQIDQEKSILGTKFLVDESKASELIANLFNNNQDLLRFKGRLYEVASKLSANGDRTASMKYNFLSHLETRVALLISFAAQYSLTAEEHNAIANDFEEYRKIVVEQVENSDYPAEIEKELVDTLNELLVNIGFQGERNAGNQYNKWSTVRKFTDTIGRLYDEYGEKFDEDQLSTGLRKLLDWFFVINSEYVLRVAMTGHQNAFYVPEGNSLSIPEANLLITRNSTPAAKAGSLMATIGHELHHSLFNSYLTIEEEDKYAKRRNCLENHMENVCQEYQPHCHSGRITFREDSADLEGIQGAIIWLQRKLGDDYKKPIFENTTNEQLFFYAYAAGWCDNVVDTTNSEKVHSSSIARVNGPLSLSTTFREAFQCKDDHRMMKLAGHAPDNCNFFGEALR